MNFGRFERFSGTFFGQMTQIGSNSVDTRPDGHRRKGIGMNRRSVLKILAGTLFGTAAFESTSQAQQLFQDGHFGWTPDDASLRSFIQRNEYPFVSQQNDDIKGTGKGKKAFLHLAYERVSGHAYVPHDQGAPDCVSHAAALAVDFLAAVQIASHNASQRWASDAATEPIYGGSRVEIGRYTGIGGGSTGHWAAEWVNRYGILHRKEYPGGFDFTTYSASKAVEYGREGCPDPLEFIAKLHPVKRTAICTSYRDLCDLIYNGSPVMICSGVGFGKGKCRRDSEGFLRRRRRPWYHAMLAGGFDDEYRRPGALIFNSWGEEWVYGPTRGPQPASTFWVDAVTIDRMLGEGDSFAFSAYVGFPRTIIPNYILR